MFRCLILILGMCFLPLAHADAELSAARALFDAGKADEAYERLSPKEFDRAGDVDFDYLFGLSALAAGHSAQAMLAFERVLAVDPGFAAAYVDMGRAFYAQGDFDRAEQSFAVAKSLNAPPDALATIRNYEKAIAAKRDPSRLKLNGYIELAAGTDGNVNQATNANSVAIPAFGGSFTLGANSRARRDDYGAATMGGEAQYALAESTTLYAGGDLMLRDHDDLNAYDVGSIDGRAGVAFSDGRNLYRFGGGYNDYRLESDRYRGVATALGEWRHAYDANTTTALSAQYNEVRYVTADQRGNDVNIVTLGAGLQRVFPRARPVTAFAGSFLGREREERNRTDGNREFAGLRLGASLAADSSLDLFANASAQIGLYSRYNSLFLVRRRDAQYDLGLGANWRFASDWSLRPQVAISRNDSNVAIYDTLRYDVSVSLRRDFR